MIIFFGIIVGIIVIAHAVVYKTIIFVFEISRPVYKYLLGVLFVVLSFSFVITSSLESKYANKILQTLYYGASVWTGILMYAFLISCIYGIVLALSTHTLTEKRKLLVGKIFLGISLVIGFYGLIHAQNIKITTVAITLPHTPSEWIGKKAVWISDIHLGRIHTEVFAKNVVDKIQTINPDIIFLGGDIFDGSAKDPKELIQPFSQLHAPWGTYFITGNHEEFSNPSQYIDAVKQIGIHPLINESAEINRMQIIGVDYQNTTQKNEFQKILDTFATAKDEPKILLKHTPLDLDIAAHEGISLQISGHTHDGQTFPMNIITHLVYKGFDYGLHTFDAMQVYTSSGVGTWGPPLRVGTSPEIVVFEFK